MRPAVLARAASLYAVLAAGESQPPDAVTVIYGVHRPQTTYTTTQVITLGTHTVPTRAAPTSASLLLPTALRPTSSASSSTSHTPPPSSVATTSSFVVPVMSASMTASSGASLATPIPSTPSTQNASSAAEEATSTLPRHERLGQKICNPNVCIAGTREDGTDTYVIETVRPTPRDKFGWIALGFGTAMQSSPLVIMWPSSDGITLSQRQAAGHIQPDVVDPPRAATLLGNSYSNASGTSMRFSVPASSNTEEDVIWAFSKTQPRSSDPNAHLSQHIWSGGGRIDFGVVFNDQVNSNGEEVQSPTTEQNGMPSGVLVAHIAIGVMVTAFLLPAGVVVPSVIRGVTASKAWLYAYLTVQGVLSLILLLVTLGTGAGFKGPPTPHRGLGIALFVFFLAQCIFGIAEHLCTRRRSSPFSRSNIVHFGFGLLLIVLGFATCWTGFVGAWQDRGHGYSALSLRAGWGIMLAFWLIAYGLALWFTFPRQRKLEEEAREIDERDQKKYFPNALDKLQGAEEPVTPRPPEPLQQFSPPPSPSMIPISTAAPWVKPDIASPRRIEKRPSGGDLRKNRMSDMYSGMPTATVVPRVSSRDAGFGYEETISRQASEESLATSRYSRPGSRGSYGSLKESLTDAGRSGMNSLRNSVSSLRSGRDAPPVSFPFRRDSSSGMYATSPASDPFKTPVTPTFKADLSSPVPSPVTLGDRRNSADDQLSFRARKRSARTRPSSAQSTREASFSYRERQPSEASYVAIEPEAPKEEPLRLVDQKDADPFGLNDALKLLNGFGETKFTFSADLFKRKDDVVDAITGVRERKASRRRNSDQSELRSKSRHGSDAAPSSFTPRSRKFSGSEARAVEGRRSLDAAPSSYPPRKRADSGRRHRRGRSRSSSRSAPSSPAAPPPQPRRRPHIRPVPKPPTCPMPEPPTISLPSDSGTTIPHLRTKPLRGFPAQPTGDLRFRRLSQNSQPVPTLRVQTGRRPPVSPSGSASSGSGAASVPITKNSAPLASPVVPFATSPRSPATTPGHSIHSGHLAPYSPSLTNLPPPIASRFARFRDEDAPPLRNQDIH